MKRIRIVTDWNWSQDGAKENPKIEKDDAKLFGMETLCVEFNQPEFRIIDWRPVWELLFWNRLPCCQVLVLGVAVDRGITVVFLGWVVGDSTPPEKSNQWTELTLSCYSIISSQFISGYLPSTIISLFEVSGSVSVTERDEKKDAILKRGHGAIVFQQKLTHKLDRSFRLS